MSTDVEHEEVEVEAQQTQEAEAPEAIEDDSPLTETDQEYIERGNRAARPKPDGSSDKSEAEEDGEADGKAKAEEEAEEEPDKAEWISPPVLELAAAVGIDEATLREHFSTPEDFQRFLVIRDLQSRRPHEETFPVDDPQARAAAEAEAARKAAESEQRRGAARAPEETADGEAIEDSFPLGERVSIPPPLEVEEVGEAAAASDRALRQRIKRLETISMIAIGRLEDGLARIAGYDDERFQGLLDQLGRAELYGTSLEEADDGQRKRRDAVLATLRGTKDARLRKEHVKRASDGTHYQELFNQLRKGFTTKVKKQSQRRTRAGGASSTKTVKSKNEGNSRISGESLDKLGRLWDELELGKDREE